jgi:hypothetical protein
MMDKPLYTTPRLEPKTTREIFAILECIMIYESWDPIEQDQFDKLYQKIVYDDRVIHGPIQHLKLITTMDNLDTHHSWKRKKRDQ